MKNQQDVKLYFGKYTDSLKCSLVKLESVGQMSLRDDIKRAIKVTETSIRNFFGAYDKVTAGYV